MRTANLLRSDSWRSFMSEVGIIVLGVLIALGAQQVAESYSERSRADAAMQGIRREVGAHEFPLAEIEMVAPCIHAQIDRVQQRLLSDDPAALEQFQFPGLYGASVIRVPSRVYSATMWQSVNDADVLRRLEPEYIYQMSGYYAQVGNQADVNLAANSEANQLATLGFRMPQSESERLRYFDATARLRRAVSMLDLVAGQLRDRLAHIGLGANDRAIARQVERESGTFQFCREHNLPTGKLRPPNPWTD